jgi:hypothetical protein
MNRRSAVAVLIGLACVPWSVWSQETSPSTDDGWKVRDQQIQLVWTQFCDLLRSGDLNSAVLYFTEESRDRYVEAFRGMGDSVRNLPDSWSELRMIEEFGPFASYSLIRTNDGERRLHFVTFYRDEKGQWFLSSL